MVSAILLSMVRRKKVGLMTAVTDTELRGINAHKAKGCEHTSFTCILCISGENKPSATESETKHSSVHVHTLIIHVTYVCARICALYTMLNRCNTTCACSNFNFKRLGSGHSLSQSWCIQLWDTAGVCSKSQVKHCSH